MSSTRSNPSPSNWAPTVSTQAACPGEVEVPQIAYFRMGEVYRRARRRLEPGPARGGRRYFTLKAAYCPAL